VLKLAVMVRGGALTNQSTVRRRGFIETGTKQSVTDRLGREELQQWRI